jgi:hypothetical protein
MKTLMIEQKRSLLLSLLIAAGSHLNTSCAATQTGAEADIRSIDSIPELEALPADARPVIKVSVHQSSQNEVPSELRWLLAFRNNDTSVASGENLESKIVRALSSTNRFQIRVNETSLITQERDLENAGYLRDDSPAEIEMLKAQYSIRFNVESLNLAESESGNRFGLNKLPLIGGAFNLENEKVEATVMISAEVVNLKTGTIVQTGRRGLGRITGLPSTWNPSNTSYPQRRAGVNARGIALARREA